LTTGETAQGSKQPASEQITAFFIGKKEWRIHSETWRICSSDIESAGKQNQNLIGAGFSHNGSHIIEASLLVLHGQDVFVCMATGSGKSLCMF
jgi:superfamily II DNA/RNA helicase